MRREELFQVAMFIVANVGFALGWWSSKQVAVLEDRVAQLEAEKKK